MYHYFAEALKREE